MNSRKLPIKLSEKMSILILVRRKKKRKKKKEKKKKKKGFLKISKLA